MLVAAADDDAHLRELAARRERGEPMAHVVGWTEFAGRRIAVDPGVFVPRPRTEALVERAVAVARPGAVVLDLCCGSGALGVAIAAAVPGVELHVADVDPVAASCARRNVVPFGGRVHLGDLFAPLPPELLGRVDVLVANVPYVPSRALATLPVDVREHEPPHALDGGRDGLDLLRRVAADAATWLAPSGHLLAELSEPQVPAAVALLRVRGLVPVVAHDRPRRTAVVVARRGHGAAAQHERHRPSRGGAVTR